jgi:peptidoglycan-associated lipoprotein
VPALPAPREFSEVAALSDVLFDFDRATIRIGDAEVLRRNAEWLKASPATLVLVEGHADERGTSEYNLALAERRAKAVRDFLATLGVDGARISLVSYGKERPVCAEAAESCWARNRRAHFLVK